MKKNILFILVTWMFMQACYEDKGHYSYIEPNEITMDLGFVGDLQTYVGEEFYFRPKKVSWSRPQDSTNFKFWWEENNVVSAEGTPVVVCTGLELAFVPRESGRKTYTLCAQDTTTGLITSWVVPVNAQAVYENGWLVLTENNGKSELSLIRPGYEIEGEVKRRVYTPFINIFEGRDLGSGPLKVRFLYSSQASIVLVIQEDEPLWLNGLTMEPDVKLANEFVGGVPAGFRPKDFFENSRCGVVLDANGNVYTRNPDGSNVFYTSEFAPFPLRYKGEEVKVESLIRTDVNVVMYDREKGRLLWLASDYFSQCMMFEAAKSNVPGFLDLSDMGDARVIFCSGYNEISAGFPRTDFVLLYEKGGETYLQTWRSNYDNRQNPTLIVFDNNDGNHPETNEVFKGKEFISDESVFYMSVMSSYLFFATDGVVYWYNVITGETCRFYDEYAGKAKVVAFSTNPQENELGVAMQTADGARFMTLKISSDALYATSKLCDYAIPGKMIYMDYKFKNTTQKGFRNYSFGWD